MYKHNKQGSDINLYMMTISCSAKAIIHFLDVFMPIALERYGNASDNANYLSGKHQ